MQRPNIVVIGGTEDQPLQCVYCGAEGAQALDTFQAAANDGRNELVRLFIYPDYSRVATPMKDGVEPAEDSETEDDGAPTAEDSETEDDGAPTAEAHAAAQASIKDLFEQLEAERAKNADCERSHKAALKRISTLEGQIAKATKPVQPFSPPVQPAA